MYFQSDLFITTFISNHFNLKTRHKKKPLAPIGNPKETSGLVIAFIYFLIDPYFWTKSSMLK